MTTFRHCDEPSSFRAQGSLLRRISYIAATLPLYVFSGKSAPITSSRHGNRNGVRRVCPTSRNTRSTIMAYVVCEPCNDCKYTDCVAVCPCDCFYQDERQLYIDPDPCIDCAA